MKYPGEGPGELLFTREQIAEAVAALAERVDNDFVGADLVLVGVLKGAFIFLSDIARALNSECEIDFLWLSSYEGGRSSSGSIQVERDIQAAIEGRDVLVVEDIVDTGLSLEFLRSHLSRKSPRRLACAALIDKTGRRQASAEVEYAGFEIQDGFVVGYGMDDAERYRDLPEIYRLTDDG